MSKTHTKTAAYIADREKGMTLQQIADKNGVSKQYVAQVVGKQSPKGFRVITEECVYPNLRKWMNANKVSRAELCRRMGITSEPSNIARLRTYMNGRADPPKRTIDKMLQVTGMTYEVLFYREDKNGKEVREHG